MAARAALCGALGIDRVRAEMAQSAPYASKPEETRGRRFDEPPSKTRSVFQRDRDRIIHSDAFRRLQYKTQVFVYHEGDYYRTRLTHSIEVAQIARSIGRQLGLNEDLAEALALAHDLGHTPFGHAGEDALNAAMKEHGGFDHNEHAFRIVTSLERRYALFDGLNLTWETLEGLVKHNGPMDRPRPSILAFCRDFDLELTSFAGLEAQVAALADDIAYNSHDVADGLRAGLFDVDDLRALRLTGAAFAAAEAQHGALEPGRLRHEAGRRLIDAMVTDLVSETRARLAECNPATAADIRTAGRAMAAFSTAMAAQQAELRQFLFTRMYRHYRVNRMMVKARRIVRELFAQYMETPDCLPDEWRVQASDSERSRRAQVIGDYIAGMTDRYAIREFERLFDLYHLEL